MKRPVILLTVCRRYYELSQAIERIWEAHANGEFKVEPQVWIVWARPVVGHLWYFQKLIREKKVHRLITRQELPGEEGGATSYPESHNLRIGLHQAMLAFNGQAYAIGQAADVLPHPGTYKFVDDNINEQHYDAVLFHWDNGVTACGVWHTNFFAVPLDESYWPPLSTPENQDVLESQWGKKLIGLELPGILRSHNYNQKRFLHTHSSETQPPWPIFPQVGDDSVRFAITGWKPWWERLWDWLLGRC